MWDVPLHGIDALTAGFKLPPIHPPKSDNLIVDLSDQNILVRVAVGKMGVFIIDIRQGF